MHVRKRSWGSAVEWAASAAGLEPERWDQGVSSENGLNLRLPLHPESTIYRSVAEDIAACGATGKVASFNAEVAACRTLDSLGSMLATKCYAHDSIHAGLRSCR